MSVTVTDLRCPHCGKKLAEATTVTQGEIRIKCPRCGNVVAIKA